MPGRTFTGDAKKAKLDPTDPKHLCTRDKVRKLHGQAVQKCDINGAPEEHASANVLTPKPDRLC